MRTCPNCGAVIENDNAKFCKKCGKPLPPVVKPPTPPNTGSSYGATPDDDHTRYGGYQTNGQGISLSGNDRPVTHLSGTSSGYQQPPVNPVDPMSPWPQQPRPKTYLLLAILSTLLCCVPTGIYAIYCSTKVDTYYTAGDYNAALMYSDKAKKWSVYPAIIMVVVYIIIFALAFIGELTNYRY